VVAQQFNQALVVGQIGFGAVSKKRQPQSQYGSVKAQSHVN
jgi:hypothetical protein